jgi:hypothetical protein
VTLKEGAVVKLDPNSSIRVVGDLKYDVPQPSKQQLQEEATIGDHELPFTSYVIFKSTNYNAGQVVTGWGFDLSDPIRPKYQFCYYTQSLAKGAAYKYSIAFNGSPRTLTVDTITGGNRERDLRTGFTSPPRLTPKSLLSFALHPRWAVNYFTHEKFELPQLKDYVKEGSNVTVSVGDYFSTMLDQSMNWQDAAVCTIN